MESTIVKPGNSSWNPLRGAVIGTLLLAVGAAALGRFDLLSMLLILTAGVAVTGYFLLRGLEWGIVVLPIVAVAVPFQIGTGSQSGIVAALMLTILLFGVWVVRTLVNRQVNLRYSRMNIPLLTVSLMWVLSYFYANATMSPLVNTWATFPVVQAAGLAIALISYFLLFLTLNALREMHWIRFLTWAFLGISSLAYLAVKVAPGSALRFFSISGLFSMWVIALAFSQALFNNELSWLKRFMLMLLSFAWLYRQIMEYFDWVSGWLPAIVALLVICFLRSKRLFAIVVVALAVVTAVNFDQIFPAYEASQGAGDAHRLDLWLQAWDLTRNHLWFGTGPAGYALYYMSYYADAVGSTSTHSNYLDIFAQTGLFGSLAFAWFLVELFFLCWRVQDKHRQGFAAGFSVGVFGGFIATLVAMGLGDWLIPFVYNQTIAGFRYTIHSWLFFGALASMENMKQASGASCD